MSVLRRLVLLAAVPLALTVRTAAADVAAGAAKYAAGDYTGALAEWSAPGLENDPAALYNLGQMHRLGKGVPANDRQAVGYYERAAKLGHAGAQANLGTLLYFAPAPLGDITAAIGWWREAAKVNEPHALYMLSVLMFNGELVARDWPRAYAYARLAASQGVNEAAAAVATMTKTLGAEDRQSSDALLVALSAPPASPQPNPASSAPVRVAAAQPVKVAAKPSPAPQSAPAFTPDAASTPDAPWRVQLGAYGSKAKAQDAWAEFVRKRMAFTSRQPVFEQAGSVVRLHLGLGEKAEARDLCAQIRSAGINCLVVPRGVAPARQS